MVQDFLLRNFLWLVLVFLATNANALTLEDLEQRGAVRISTIWRWANDQAPKTIHVCWENPTDANTHGRSIVEEAVKRTWQEHTKLTFLGWSACADGTSGIRILIADIQPQLRPPYLGREIDGVPRGMRLNFTFENFDAGCQEGTKDIWIARIAVHEFGHAIGFTHEQNRDDTPSTCTALKQGTRPDSKLTPWDDRSIMNYCYCAGDAELSPLDVEAAQKLYDPR